MLLLDTHVVIWLYAAMDRISDKVREEVADSDRLAFSAVSAWEYGQKRVKFGEDFGPPLMDLLSSGGIETLDFPFSCHLDAEALPPIHRDPFDRMLIAHARHLDCTLVTKDKVIAEYPVNTLW